VLKTTFLEKTFVETETPTPDIFLVIGNKGKSGVENTPYPN